MGEAKRRKQAAAPPQRRLTATEDAQYDQVAVALDAALDGLLAAGISRGVIFNALLRQVPFFGLEGNADPALLCAAMHAEADKVENYAAAKLAAPVDDPPKKPDGVPLSSEELRRCLDKPVSIHRDPAATMDAAQLAKARRVLIGKACLGGCGANFTEALPPVALVHSAPSVQGLCVDCADALDDATIVDLQTECLQADLAQAKAIHQGFFDAIAHGDIVPSFDPDGNPEMRDGQQVYIHRDVAEQLEALATDAAEWLERNDASDQAAVDYLRGAHPDLAADILDYAARRAVVIRRGSAP